MHEKYHRDIIYGTLNFNGPLPYEREIWDYEHANTEIFRKLFESLMDTKHLRIKTQMKRQQ